MKRRNFLTVLLGLMGAGTAETTAKSKPFNENSMAYNMMGNPTTLEEAIRQRDGWVEAAARHLDNEEYYRALLIECGVAIGPAAYTQDDGNLTDEVLCAKVPGLVRELATPVNLQSSEGIILSSDGSIEIKMRGG